jgi:GNAT superfamily N-acetyltransferase
MSITIRPVRQSELEQVRALTLAAYGEYEQLLEPTGWAQMRTGLERVARLAERGEMLVATNERGELVGSVTYFAPGHEQTDLFPAEWAHIRLLAVHPAGRGQGVGRLLTEACIACARRDAAVVLGLHTSQLNHGARRLYSRLGFEPDEPLPPRFGIPYDRFRLNLPVGGSLNELPT